MENYPNKKPDLADTLPPSLLDDSSGVTWGNIAEKAPPFGQSAELLDDKEKIEKRLRGELIDAYENRIDKERRAYGYVANALSDAGYGVFSGTVDEYGMDTAEIDGKLCEEILGYIDAKFSPDPHVVESRKTHQEEYERTINSRAGVAFDMLDSIRRGLCVSGSERFDNTIDTLSHMKDRVPEGQINLARAYFAYFEDPTEQNKGRLNEHVNGYINSTRRGISELAEDVYTAVPRSADLADTLDSGLGRNVSQGYEDVHEAVIKYFDFKQNGTSESNPQSSKNNEKPNAKASINRVLDLIG